MSVTRDMQLGEEGFLRKVIRRRKNVAQCPDLALWLARLGALVRGWLAAGESAVLACSALTAASREVLGVGSEGFVLAHNRGPEPLLCERLEHQAGHYSQVSLPASHLAMLEAPEAALEVSVEPGPEAITLAIRRALGLP